MNINQIKIRNLNKKLIASVLAFTIVGTVVNGFNNAKNIGELNVSKSTKTVASFEKLKKCYFVEICNSKDNSTQFYIAEKIDILNEKKENVGSLYLNLLDGKNIFVKNIPFNMFSFDYSSGVASELSVEEYLNDSEIIKNMYTEDDIMNLIEYIKNSSYSEKNKELVKE